MNSFPKLIIVIGVGFILIGVVWLLIGRFIPLGKLPGDIMIKKENTTFFFPVVTCIVISIVLSIIVNLFSRFR